MKLRTILNELLEDKGGQSAGSMELASIDVKTAREYIERLGLKIPNFEKHFELAQKKAHFGKTKRRDMPVIDDTQVRQFQQRLKTGVLDIHTPFAKETDPTDPFPEGLRGLTAQDFLIRGLKDNNLSDDKIGVTIRKISIDKLKPIQRQIYFDKSAQPTAKNGIKKTIDFISNKSFFVVSEDDFIIDGHHRFLSAVLIDPKMQVNVLSIDLPLSKLLPLSKAYGDAIGNTRNA